MLNFLANVLEQLDLSLEHLEKSDPNNARFSLMLTDNVAELCLHQLAKDKHDELKGYAFRNKPYRETSVLKEALENHFNPKVKFGRMLGLLSAETAETVMRLHLFRNEVYHVGIQHEAVLPSIAAFYFKTACDFIGGYSPPYVNWNSNQRLPERAEKYFRGDPIFPGFPKIPGDRPQFQAACGLLAGKSCHDPKAFARDLANHMAEVIENQNTGIDAIAEGVYAHQKTTRDQAIVECQIWPLAFSAEGKEFAQRNGWKGEKHFAYVDWLSKSYPLKYKRDPISGWRRRAERLQGEKNPHTALKMYRSFMDDTTVLRGHIDEAWRLVEQEIDTAIERARGN
jgi:hypothetical protein